MKYTDLIFDLYGTLLDIHTEENESVWEKTAIYFGFYGASFTGQELKKSFKSLMKSYESNEGQNYECFPDIPFEEVMAQLFRAKGIEQNANTLGVNASQLFRILSIEYIKLYPNVIDALKLLRKKGYRLWLLSNAQRVFTEYELRYVGLLEQFDGIYISSDHRCRKPDERFFKALLNKQNLNPNTCLMIGNDRETDILGAKKLGISTLYMHTNLTPLNQACADLNLLPTNAVTSCSHYEYEGSNWMELVKLLCNL